MNRPLREHFETETDAGTALQTFRYIEALEVYLKTIESIVEEAYEDGYDAAFHHEQPNFKKWLRDKNQSQPTEKEQDTTDWHYQFRELSKSHVAQANLIHNLKCQLSDFLESSTKRETGTHPGRKKSKRKS